MQISTDSPFILRTVYEVHPDVVMGITQTDERLPGTSPIHLLAQAYELDAKNMRTVHQTHSADVVDVGLMDQPDANVERDADAMTTSRQGVMLAIKVADCCAVLMFDPRTGATAIAHSGWRGTHQGIVHRTVESLINTHGTCTEDLIVVLAPCASGERYLVREDVASLFPAFVRPYSADQWHFDNRAAIVHQLSSVGVLQRNIHIDVADTLVDLRYHSHRRDGNAAGRSIAFIMHLAQT